MQAPMHVKFLIMNMISMWVIYCMGYNIAMLYTHEPLLHIPHPLSGRNQTDPDPAYQRRANEASQGDSGAWSSNPDGLTPQGRPTRQPTPPDAGRPPPPGRTRQAPPRHADRRAPKVSRPRGVGGARASPRQEAISASSHRQAVPEG